MDVLSVREAARYAVAHCTEDKGPILLEMMTYRYSGHSMSDPGTSYRTREEVSEVRQTRDPITSFRELILNASLATPEKIKVPTLTNWVQLKDSFYIKTRLFTFKAKKFIMYVKNREITKFSALQQINLLCPY